jgi:hypothetical protein
MPGPDIQFTAYESRCFLSFTLLLFSFSIVKRFPMFSLLRGRYCESTAVRSRSCLQVVI